MLKKFLQNGNINTPSQETSTPLPNSEYTVKTNPLPSHTASPTISPVINTSPTSPVEGNKLTVGPNIKLKGSEITDCEILIVEGRVEASMKSHVIRIAQGGIFCGKAEIDVAEIAGNFEGELIVRKHLVIYATGKVTGKIHYGSMTVEEGGIIAGSMEKIGPVQNTMKASDLTSPTLEAVPSIVTRAGATYPSHLLSRHMANKRQGQTL